MINLKLLIFVLVLSRTVSYAQISDRPKSDSKRFEVINRGVAGNNSSDLLQRVRKDALAEDPDLVVIMVGTNDMLNSKKLISYQEYENNYQSIIDILKTSDTEILLMSSPPVDTAYVLKRHNRKAFHEDLNSKIFNAGRIVEKLANRNKLHFIDLHATFERLGSPNRDSCSLIINKTNYGVEDGVHPTRDGYKLIADTIFTYLKQKKLLTRKMKIICFGDSMTYGSYMKGEGTVEGDPYPAQLKSLLVTQ